MYIELKTDIRPLVNKTVTEVTREILEEGIDGSNVLRFSISRKRELYRLEFSTLESMSS